MESVAHNILRSETAKRFDQLKNSEATPEFRERFSDVLGRFIFSATKNIPPVPPTQTISLEGSVGVLPSPAKRIVAQDVLQGNAPTPLKVVDETIQTGIPERPVDLVSIHVISEVESLTTGSSKEQDKVAAVLLYLESILNRKNIYLESQQPNEPPVRVAQIRSLFHLIKRGAFGQYSVERHALNKSSDVPSALDAYQESLNYVLPFQQGEKPSEDMVAHGIIDPKIIAEVRADASGPKVSVPVVVAPKQYAFKRGYGRGSTELIRNFYNGDPFILVQADDYPRLVYYDFQRGYLMDIE